MDAKAAAVGEQVAIRPLAPQDVGAVTRILGESPEAANWSEKSIAESLGWREVLSLVSELKGELTGFLIGRATGEEAEILNIAVVPGRRRQGDGGALLAAALAEFKARGVKRVFLEVRDSNQQAIAFYNHAGFSKRGLRPGYYQGPAEAAVLLEKILTD